MSGSAVQNYQDAKAEIDRCLYGAGYVPHPTPKEKIVGTKETYVPAWKTPKDERLLILVRTQENPGTAGQKVPFFILALWDLFRQKRDIDRAYIVLCGDTWPLMPVFQAAAQTLAGIRFKVVSAAEFMDSATKQLL